MSLREALIMALVVTIVLTGVVWFLSTHERVSEEIWTGFRGEARRNPWLAAERFLNRVDLAAGEVRTLPQLRSLPARATLVVPATHHTISGPLRDALVAWVGQGGYLIVEAEHPAQQDALVDAFGVRRYLIDPADFDQAETASDAQLTRIRLPNAAAPAALDMQQYVLLETEEAWFHARNRYGTLLVALRVGTGMVTIISDLDYLSNGAIGNHDHARFLWDLVQLRDVARSGRRARTEPSQSGAPEQHAVLFFNQPAKLSLAGWLRKHAWAPLGGGAAALLLWLWRVAPRFGPVAPDAPRARRRLLDHLRASGRFLWANGHAARLLEASREACLRRIARSLPHFLSASPDTRAAQLVQALGLTEEQAQRILQPQQSEKMIHFFHTIRLYQRVYSRLAPVSAPSAAEAD